MVARLLILTISLSSSSSVLRIWNSVITHPDSVFLWLISSVIYYVVDSNLSTGTSYLCLDPKIGPNLDLNPSLSVLRKKC